jgi:hypothetical protein|tara:strand:- start:6371 stop:6898 length:528 start_codon:yes stop_codon:yes gene_type:complete
MISKVILNFILLCFAFISCSCGAIHQAYEKQEVRIARLQFKDPLHVRSCGPGAIRDALNPLGVNASINEISQSIQKKNSPFKCFISIFENDARKITWPSEIVKFIQTDKLAQDLEIVKLENSNQIKKEDVIIFLIKKKYSLRNYHWISYPTYSLEQVDVFFGEDTEIVILYRIRR